MSRSLAWGSRQPARRPNFRCHSSVPGVSAPTSFLFQRGQPTSAAFERSRVAGTSRPLMRSTFVSVWKWNWLFTHERMALGTYSSQISGGSTTWLSQSKMGKSFLTMGDLRDGARSEQSSGERWTDGRTGASACQEHPPWLSLVHHGHSTRRFDERLAPSSDPPHDRRPTLHAGAGRRDSQGRGSAPPHAGPMVREGRARTHAELRRGNPAALPSHRAGAGRPHRLVREHGPGRPVQRTHGRADAAVWAGRAAPAHGARAGRARRAVAALADRGIPRSLPRIPSRGVVPRVRLEPRAEPSERGAALVARPPGPPPPTLRREGPHG